MKTSKETFISSGEKETVVKKTFGNCHSSWDINQYKASLKQTCVFNLLLSDKNERGTSWGEFNAALCVPGLINDQSSLKHET